MTEIVTLGSRYDYISFFPVNCYVTSLLYQWEIQNIFLSFPLLITQNCLRLVYPQSDFHPQEGSTGDFLISSCCYFSLAHGVDFESWLLTVQQVTMVHSILQGSCAVHSFVYRHLLRSAGLFQHARCCLLWWQLLSSPLSVPHSGLSQGTSYPRVWHFFFLNKLIPFLQRKGCVFSLGPGAFSFTNLRTQNA